MKNEMTPKERILAAINHEPVDKIPTDYWGTPEATNKLLKALGLTDMSQLWPALEIDKIINIQTRYVGPSLQRPGNLTADFWGAEYRPVSVAGNESVYAEICRSPLQDFETIDEIEANYTWPKTEWFDYSSIAGQISCFPDYAVECGYIAPFYMYTKIRGMEQSLIDMAADEPMADYIISHICDFLYEHHKLIFEAAQGGIDIAQVTDDFGTQQGLIMGIDMIRKYFFKSYRRFIRLLKDHGIRVFHHDDGAIMELVPDLVDLGVEILNPLQWHLPGMDLAKLKSCYGSQLCFHGGIDNQFVLPFGTREDVVNEVNACLDILAGDGTGYILAPCHNVQVISPVENVLAMYETANHAGKRA